MIKLHQFPKGATLPSLSPFCVKVEVFLKMAKIPYEVVWEQNPRKGPKGKMPFIQAQGKKIADSSLILEYLMGLPEGKAFLLGSPQETAVGLAFKKMVEESLYFSLLYARWVDPAGIKVIKASFRKGFPPVVGDLVFGLVRKSCEKQTIMQGTGRHKKQEVYDLAQAEIQALSDYLGDKKYFMGDRLTFVDATIWSFLATIRDVPMDTPIYKKVLTLPNLLAYIERMSTAFFPEVKYKDWPLAQFS